MPAGGAEQTLLLMRPGRLAVIGMKLATITPGNGARGLPAVNAVYLWSMGRPASRAP